MITVTKLLILVCRIALVCSTSASTQSSTTVAAPLSPTTWTIQSYHNTFHPVSALFRRSFRLNHGEKQIQNSKWNRLFRMRGGETSSNGKNTQRPSSDLSEDLSKNSSPKDRLESKLHLPRGGSTRQISSSSTKDDGFVEPICATDEECSRFSLFPLEHFDLWSMYKQHVASFWTADEIDLSADLDDWRDKLTPNERHFISMVLAFFAGADGIVVENLAERFCREVTVPEARCFYGFQMAMESIHQETYCLLIDSYIANPEDRATLFKAHTHVPSVERKAKWAQKYIGSDAEFAERLVADRKSVV